MNETVETIYESWVNGQKKQAVKQLREAEDYFDTINEIKGSELIPESEKVELFAYALKYLD